MSATTQQADQPDHEPRSTRRGFVTGVAKKAAYVAPAVMVLTAAQRVAADYTGCTGPGSPCTTGIECCNYVDAMSCHPPATMMACMGEPDCICD